MPPNGDSYRWRVSVAQIDQSGPFSDFSGYRRHMVLLQGLGLMLKFGDGGQQCLSQVGDLAEFDGAVATHCNLLQGPCTDLNLIVAADASVRARVERVLSPVELEAPELQTTLIFSIESALKLARGNGETAYLEPWDLAMVSGEHVRVLAADEAASATPRAVFFATISG